MLNFSESTNCQLENCSLINQLSLPRLLSLDCSRYPQEFFVLFATDFEYVPLNIIAVIRLAVQTRLFSGFFKKFFFEYSWFSFNFLLMNTAACNWGIFFLHSSYQVISTVLLTNYVSIELFAQVIHNRLSSLRLMMLDKNSVYTFPVPRTYYLRNTYVKSSNIITTCCVWHIEEG